MTDLPRQDDMREGDFASTTSWSRIRIPAVVIVWAVAALILTLLLSERLTSPPLWDAAWSTSAGAAELSRNGFDYAALLSAPPFDQGGPGTHASSLLTPLLGAFFVLFGSPGGLIAGHVLMLVVGSALVAVTFHLARRYLTLLPALAVAGAVLLLPLIVQQVADPYVELPLALFTLLAVVTFLDGSRVRMALFAGLAIWFKPTGLILLPLVLLMGQRDEPRRWLKNGVALVAAAMPFSIELMSRSMATHAGATPTLGGTVDLAIRAMWILGATTDVLVILALYAMGVFRRRNTHSRLIGASTMATAGFFALHFATMALSQAVTILPRYYVALLPLWLIVVAVDLTETHSKHVATGAAVALMVFSIINWNGSYYPLADQPQAPMAERTPGGARTYLDMEIEGARALVAAAARVEVILPDLAMSFRLRYPELGFVSSVPEKMRADPDLETDPPRSFASIEEPHVSSWRETYGESAQDMGWLVETTPIWEERWRSDLVIATKP